MSSRINAVLRRPTSARVGERLQETGRRVTGAWAGWLDSALESFGAHVGRQAASDREGIRAHADREELARQEEIKLVQRVFLTPGIGSRRSVLFTGVERDNGCAGICARAGRTLAQLTPQSVCVVDANLRAPALHQLLGVENGDGLAAAVCHPDSPRPFARQLAPDNLWLLPSGSSTSDPDMLLTPDRVRPRIQALSSLFDHVLINAPPIDVYAESLALSRFVEGVIVVVEANATRREIVRNVKARLDSFNVPLLGIVLNNRTFPIPGPLYRRL